MEFLRFNRNDWKKFGEHTLYCSNESKEGCVFEHVFVVEHILTPNDQKILLKKSQTVYYVSLLLCQIAAAICCQTEIMALWHKERFRNKQLYCCFVVEILFAVCIVYVTPFHSVFHTERIDVVHWFLVFPFIVVMFIIDELRKYYLRRR